MELPAPPDPIYTKKFAALCIFLILLAAVTFPPALHNGFTSFDDQMYVTANRKVQQGLTWAGLHYAFTAVVAANWHPLTVLSHMLDCQLYGLDPWGHHLTAVLLHTGNMILVFTLLYTLTRAPCRSFFVAAFFGLHPLRIESVAWVSERKDVLSTFFALLAILSYVKFVRMRPGDGITGTSAARSWYYALTLWFFILGLMAKPMLVTLPFVLLLLDFWPLQQLTKKNARQLLFEKVPLLLLSAAVSAVTVITQKGQGTVVSLTLLPLSTRVETSLISYAGYLGKIFWPVNLCVYYPYPDHWPMITLATSVIALALVSAGVILFARKQPWLLMGWLWFLGTLVPVIGLVQVGEQCMADRYTYIPSIGIFIGVIWSVSALASRRRGLVCLAFTVATLLVLSCVLLSRQQILVWKNSESLFRHAVEVSENNYAAEDLLGRELSRQNRIPEAVEMLEAAVRSNPTVPEIHYDLGVNLERDGRLDEACAEYWVAANIDPEDVNAWNKLGVGLTMEGKPGKAITVFESALKLNPQAADLHYNYGNALVQTGQLPEAAEQFQISLKLDPDDASAYNNLGATLFKLHRVNEAITEFRAALKLRSDNSEAERNLESALKFQNQMNTLPPSAH